MGKHLPHLPLIFIVIISILLSTLNPNPVNAQPPQPPLPGLKPVVRYAEKHDTSKPLREMAAAAKAAQVLPDETAGEGNPALRLPKAATSSDDTASPLSESPVSALMPAPIAGFDGVPNVNGMLPPDTNGDIGYDPASGKKFYFQWVNISFNIWDITNPGAPIALQFDTDRNPTTPPINGPWPGNAIWKDFGGPCEDTNDGDPIVLFDQFAHRWNVSQFSVTGPYYQCIAISQTADPTGAWYRYGFKISDTKMNDYPKLGVWPDGYYMSINQFTSTGWGGAGAVVFERDKMLLGQPARFVYFDLLDANPFFGGMLPSDADGTAPPPAGAPNYFAEWDDKNWIGPSDALRIWEFRVDWVNPTSSTFGVSSNQPNQVIPTLEVNPFSESATIPQLDTVVKLDNLADRLMHRLQYRNFGAYQSLVTNHTVNAGSGRAGIHWWELRKTSGGWFIQNENVHAPADTTHRWMGSMGMDGAGNVALGYSTASGTLHPSIAYAGRLAGDPQHSLQQAEVTMKPGTGSQTHSTGRWGDYTMMSVDPQDDCTFWYTNQYLPYTGVAPWKTWIGAFRYDSCTTASTGILSGKVLSNATSLPIAGALITVGSAQTTTAADGSYQLPLGVGSYSVTASAYGFIPVTTNNVVINTGVTTTLNFRLNPAAAVTISGKVYDPAHTNLPLYARIEIAGYPGSPIFTNPFTGQYSVQLYQNFQYTFSVSAVTGGYQAANWPVTPTSSMTHDFALTVDREACTALGYTLANPLSQTFDTTSMPAGWSVVDHTNPATGMVWVFNDPFPRTNLTGGSGSFAIVDSDDYGYPGNQNTSLITPVMNFTGYEAINLRFKNYFVDYEYSSEVADVDYSTDGGVNWTNIWRKTTSYLEDVALSFTPAGNKSNIQVRFHYYNASDSWYWQVDDVLIGACAPLAGGLVAGYVRDANTTAGLVGASVTGGITPAVTFATPQDAALGDGFYLAFAPAGTLPLTGAMPGGYQPVTTATTVVADLVTPRNFDLPAGSLGFSPGVVIQPLYLDGSAIRTVSLNNTGGVAATFTLTEAIGLPALPQVTGPFAPAGRRTSPKRLNDLTAESVRIYEPPVVPEWSGGAPVNAWMSGLTNPWGVAITRNGQVWLGSVSAGGGDDLDHRFNRQGVATGLTASTIPWASVFAADMAYDFVTGRIWQVNVGGEGCIHEMDPQKGEFTGVKICPAFGHSVRGLAFDPLSRTFYAGGWVDGNIYHFDMSGRLLDSASTGINLAGMAFNPMTGHLFVLSNAATGKDLYVLDARQGYAPLGGLDIPGMTDFGHAGLEMDESGHLWAVDQKSGQVFELESGETDILAFADVSWLSITPTDQHTIPAGGSYPVQLTFDAATLPAGTYTAHLLVAEDTPYTVTPLSITLHVGYLTMLPVIAK